MEDPYFFNIFENLTTGISFNSPSEIFGVFIGIFLFVATLAAIIVFVVAGINYITAQGKDEQTTKAKLMMVYSLVGLVVIALTYQFVGAVIQFSQSSI